MTYLPALGRADAAGLADALETLDNEDGIAVVKFNDTDVVRHPLVQRIVQAYEASSPKDER